MSEAKLQAARAYIESGDFAAAKAILEAMPDNPTAQTWLKRLVEKQSAEPSPKVHRVTSQGFPDRGETAAQKSPHPQNEGITQSHQQWEYCALGSITHIDSRGHVYTGDTSLVLFSSDGTHKTKSKVNFPTTIATLGSEVWELVGAAPVFAVATLSGQNGTPGHMLYFKRPRTGIRPSFLSRRASQQSKLRYG